MGTVGQFSLIFLPALAHNSNEIYCPFLDYAKYCQKTTNLSSSRP